MKREPKESDLPAVLEIERTSFLFPWKEACFRAEMQTPYSRFVVAEEEGRVIGYLCCWLVTDEVQILKVAVHPAHRRQGVGRVLVRETLAEARHSGARSASL